MARLLVQRSHHGQAAFVDDADRTLFRNLLGEAARTEGVSLHAYALMDEQIRLLATPATAQSLGRMMQTLGRRYGGAFNRRHQRSGGLWEGRFRATLIEPERHLLEAMRYIEDEGNWEGGAAVADIAPTSSRGHHVGKQRDSLVTDHALFWALGNTPFDREAAYRRLLDERLAPTTRMSLEQAVRSGWPLGSVPFVTSLSAWTTRRLTPLKRGRPPKAPGG
jgi:putative transposase